MAFAHQPHAPTNYEPRYTDTKYMQESLTISLIHFGCVSATHMYKNVSRGAGPPPS